MAFQTINRKYLGLTLLIIFTALILSLPATEQVFSANTSPSLENTSSPETSPSDSQDSDSHNALQNGLQAYYRFDNLRVSRGYSLEFDGNEDYVEIGDVTDGSSLDTGQVFSVSFWSKPDQEGSGLQGVLSTGGETDSWNIRNNDGEMQFRVYGQNTYSSGENVDTNKFDHWVFVMDNSKWTWYRNGENISTGTNSHDLIYNNIYIGRYHGYETFPGALEDIRLYDRTLSNSDISDLYNEKSVSGEGLVLHQTFDEGPQKCDLTSNSACLKDESGNGNDGAPNNFDDNSFNSGSGWFNQTPLNRPSLKDSSGHRNLAHFYGGKNGELKNFDFAESDSGWSSERNRGLSFDGIDDYIEVSDKEEFDQGQGDLTASTWIKIPSNYSPSNHRIIVEKAFDEHFHTNDGPGWGMSIDASGKIYGGVTDDSGSNKWETDRFTDIRDGEWHHVSLVIKNGNSIEVYLDGALEDSVSFPETDFSPSVPLGIGASANSNTRNINATIDDVKIHGRALVSSEVESLYKGEEVLKGLIGEWTFEEGNGEIVYDISGADQKGILGSEALHFSSYEEPVQGETSVSETFTVSTWIDMNEIGSKERPGESCYDIKETNPGAVSGLYWISSGDSMFEVYCDMERRGGGWTMLMKLQGQNSTFQYGSNYWENDETLNIESKRPEKNQDAKFDSYHRLNITQIRGEFPEIGHNMNETFAESMTAKTIFSSQRILGHENESGRVGDFGDFDKDNFAYQDGWQDYGFKLNNCNSRSKVRWGWIWNNEEDQCSSSDAGAGIGLTGEELEDVLQSGSWSTCCSDTPTGNTERDGDGEGDFPLRSILWGREDKPSKSTDNADIQHQGVYKIHVAPKMIKARIKGDSTNETLTYRGDIPARFTQVSLSYDGQIATLYLDGDPVKQEELSLSVGSSSNMSVGNSYSGKMDEVRVYNRSLSEQEVQQLAFQR